MTTPRAVPIYQVDAFASRLFEGNPAAVCPLDDWLPDRTLQQIASENNLAETAFFVRTGRRYRLRWFTPAIEVDLCGHATLASAHVIANELEPGRQVIEFDSRSGPLRAVREGERFALDFPSRRAERSQDDPALVVALGREPVELWQTADTRLAVFASEQDVRALEPDMAALTQQRVAVIATAPGREVDFVSRFFAPAWGIPEDPVTGSAHCTLTPYWSERLDKAELTAHQVSARGGELWLQDQGDRTRITGRTVLYLRGTIFV
jgi:PhzF family phenazine biosynthesis protein